uniref:Uncharacterized protein n=1 Tax=Panagrolaimus sp. JU765 TaxID=591449 RepID=A0AC34Q8K8_9BILA
MNQTQQSQQTAQKLLPNYTPTVQSAWTQLQDLGRSVMNGTINNTDVAQQTRQIYSSLGSQDKTFFKNLFQQVYGYSFDWIIGFMYDFLTGMNNGQSMGMGMQGNGHRMMNNPNSNGQGGMMINWNSGKDYNDENE